MTQIDGEIYHVLRLVLGSQIVRINILKNQYSTQSNLQIQHHPYQTTHGIFHRARTNNFTICMETQKILSRHSNLEKEEWNWRNQSSWLQTTLQTYSHQDSMILTQRRKYRWMEQDRHPRNKLTSLWQLIYNKGGQDIQWIRQSFSKWFLENIEKYEIRVSPDSVQKNILKMD